MATVILKSHATPGGSPRDKRRGVVASMGWQVRIQSHIWSPPTDLYETKKDYVVRVEIAGMRQQDFSVLLENDQLVISAVRPDTHERRAYHQMEVRFGEFSSVVALPGPVDAEASQAEYIDGFLVVTLPKVRPTPIDVEG